MRIFLQSMVEDIPEACLSPNWLDFEFKAFSAEKCLWDYQQHALHNAIKALWKYYENFADYRPDEDIKVNEERKRRLWEWYRDNGLQEKDFSIDLSRINHRFASLLREYYGAQTNSLSYEHFINRMSFWMATGSGKTLVIVKLIELLALLIRRPEIPPCDILFLTHRDDLIEQLKRHVEEFNRAHSDFRIVLRELRDYAAVKRENPSLFQEQEVIVFYYRSDNLSDEQKEKIVDFRNYDNDGRWYVLLDEAHKGDKEDSKRQHIYSILSRNGFLFNFSATFTDPRDIATTVFNFNLSEYIQAGYGKHIALLKQELRAFRD
ncbi:MAG: DEAD/DEAH box helicase family protein, partial [Armatimonadota bacterium]|nr:DEAD/DEAH box helicase family protein [Armatimonadota bacterium]